MQRISDSVTSIFQLETKEERLAACLQGGSTIVYSEKFGLGWRFGLQYAKGGWAFAKVKVYLDHTHCSSETDAATVTVCLKDGCASGASTFDSKTVSIADFGHGPPVLLGSFSPSSIVAHPYMWFTVTTKANFVQALADPLAGTVSAIKQSMNDSSFVNTKYYAISRRRNWRSPGKTRFLYANNAVLTQDVDVGRLGPLPQHPCFLILPGGRTIWDAHYYADCLLLQYQSESTLRNRDVEQYDYDLDSDIEEEENENPTDDEGAPSPSNSPPPHRHYSHSTGTAFVDSDVSDTASSSALSSDAGDRDYLRFTDTFAAGGPLPTGFSSTYTSGAEPLPPPFIQTYPMLLVRNTAFTTWASYVYYCYTGQVSFYPLKSEDPYSRRDKTTETLRCSPKSMYRLAVKLEHTRLQALASQAIKSSLSKNNTLDEAFSWFTAQYSDIRKMELEFLLEFRSAPEVSARLSRILEDVSQGEKPYAHAMLHAFLERLTQLGTGGMQ
ncbi:hypothetical protein DFH29DRAFT_200896 [Suillus ampliporus]|nr:hypothetical protein DFH29DRAFT_200896 [Suillus ampliporus]